MISTIGSEEIALIALAEVAATAAQQEAVELSVWQREGAMGIKGVLGGNAEELLGERTTAAINADLAFSHGFEQSRLTAQGGQRVELIHQ